GEDAGVVPPNAINQVVPMYQGQVMVPRTGRLEVVIDETGTVESAVMRAPISVAYDALVVAAAKRWSYTPATVNGAPVKFRKSIQIAGKATLRCRSPGRRRTSRRRPPRSRSAGGRRPLLSSAAASRTASRPRRARAQKAPCGTAARCRVS